MRYTKVALTYEQQLRQLADRGLTIGDSAKAELYLRRIGYYRLMGYLHPLRVAGTDNYREGARFEDAVLHYDFDGALRHLIGEAIAHIEVAVRTAVTYQLAHAYGSFAHLESANFKPDGGYPGEHGQNWHAKWIAGVNAEVFRAREIFIDHYRNKYTEPEFPSVPIYMASELMSLGSLSKLVRALQPEDQAGVASSFAVPGSVLSSWLHSLSVTRNVAAHHGRLWNRKLGVAPVVPRFGHWRSCRNELAPRRLFYTLCVIGHLLRHTAADRADWIARVSVLLTPLLVERYNRIGLGAPHDWGTHPLWAG